MQDRFFGLNCMQVISIATAQYYMHEINEKLEKIEQSLSRAELHQVQQRYTFAAGCSLAAPPGMCGFRHASSMHDLDRGTQTRVHIVHHN